MPERMTAKKISIVNLVNGEWVHQDGMEPSYVTTKKGDRVSRARILATIVNRFLSDDGNFGSITLDDGTDTIRAKCFKDLALLEKVDRGKMVELIGKVREYKGEIYLIPEIIKEIKDPNFMLLRKMELKKKAESKPDSEEAGKKSGENEAGEEKDTLRKNILGIIEKNNEGIEYAELIKQSGETEDKVDGVINDLLSEGICYEPTPGKIKKI